ncbi:helix-turn-helix domain-containing protein, partial [Streptomyces albidoflavus]|uniref:helix-turn-helix domain-containing protein n=1 Tax=Streptomyces albidoflavus TaxID=1886 RepID=UPI0020D231BE
DAVVGGVSMGGQITMEIRRLYPERVRALMLADTSYPAETEEGRAGTQGAALDEVSAAAGYQPATVTRHLEGLAERGLARLDGERWYAVAPQGAPAPA